MTKYLKKVLPIILMIVLLFITMYYTYYFRQVTDDELFNYGFAQNILNGLIPYKDFNMIIPPLFSYILALFLGILGKKLIVYHLMIALMIVGITYLCYQKIGFYAMVIYLLLLIYPYTGYNMFCLFLFFLLLIKKEGKYGEIIDAILISMMFLTKQTLGLLVISSIIFSKQKKKILSIYISALLLFLLYLILNNNLAEFVNYCLLGMLDFTHENRTELNCLLLIEIMIITTLSYMVIRFQKKDLFYLLMFQIITFPIVNYIHFCISFIPIAYLLLKKIHSYPFVSFLFLITVLFCFIAFNINTLIQNDNYLFLSPYQGDTFMKDRLTSRLTEGYITTINKYLIQYQDYHPYILGNFSYLIKLNLEIPLTKYDIINNGNLGYHGSQKYIQELKKDCEENKCIFFLNDEEVTPPKDLQTNREILYFVRDHYNRIYSSNIFSVYTNTN